MNTRSYSKQYRELFDFLSAPESPPVHSRAGEVVFGRKNKLVGRKALEVVTRQTPWIIITGGIGKDSGDLTVPEAEYLAAIMQDEKDPDQTLPPMYLDILATNGGENVRNSLDIIGSENLHHTDGLTVVSHATSLRRLAETMKHETAKRIQNVSPVYRIGSDYKFDVNNSTDRQEAIAEMVRLINWPKNDWLLPQENLPENLIDFTRDIEQKSNQ